MNYSINQKNLSSVLSNATVSQFEKHLIQEGIKKILFDPQDSVSNQMREFLSDYSLFKEETKKNEIINFGNMKVGYVNSPSFFINKNTLELHFVDNAKDSNIQPVVTGSFCCQDFSDIQKFIDNNQKSKIFFYINSDTLSIYHPDETFRYKIRCVIL